jgi:hypothetical protein
MMKHVISDRRCFFWHVMLARRARAREADILVDKALDLSKGPLVFDGHRCHEQK